MKLQRPSKKRPEYNEIRNRLIVWLVKVHKWGYEEVRTALELEYGHVITRQRVRAIYLRHRREYTIKSFKGFTAPDTLSRV